MAVKRATLEIESTGQAAYYDDKTALTDDEEFGPALTIQVHDFDEALELVETLNRSRAQKKRERKPPEPEKPEEPAPATKPAAVERVPDPPTYPPRRTGA